MQIETYTQRILIPEEGHLLCNYNAKVISDKVYLGINAQEVEWVEITIEEADSIQKEWEAEIEAE